MLQEERTPEIRTSINFWNDEPAFGQWTALQLDLVRRRGVNPVRSSRGLAIVHAAIYDAVVAAWHWKYVYARPQPGQIDLSISPVVRSPLYPSYPSEHAAIAGAASRVLAHLFPRDAEELERLAAQAAVSRMQAGVNYRSDVGAGLVLGRAVADAVIKRRALVDGSDAVWDPEKQPGRLARPGFWEPTAPGLSFPPTEPLAGDWRTWVIPSGKAFLAPSPPGFELVDRKPSIKVTEIMAPARAIVDSVTVTRANSPDGAGRRAVISFWAGVPGDRWNVITRELLVSNQVNLPRAARIAALVNVALADAIVSSWKTKYTYWTARPQTIIRQQFDPTFLSFRPTPADPSYTSGLSTVSGAVSEILAFFFPNDAERVRRLAADAAMSRFFDGSHWPFDNEAGAAVGKVIAPLFIRRAEGDGANPVR